MNWVTFCLEDRHKLLISTPLAEAIGINEAIFIRQLNYWLQKRGAVQLEGEGDVWWVYGSYKSWRDRNFRFWSERTVRRVIDGLVKLGIVRKKRHKNKETGAEEAPYYTLNKAKLNQILKDYFDKNPDSLAWYLANGEDNSDGMDNLDTPPVQNGQQQHENGMDNLDTPPVQNGHQRDSDSETLDSKNQEIQERKEGASRKTFFAFLKHDQLKYLDGTPADPVTFPNDYNEIFYAACDALEAAGIPRTSDYETLWEKQREGAVSLARAKVLPDQVKEYIAHLLTPDEGGNNWYLSSGRAPLLSTIATNIGAWLAGKKDSSQTSKQDSWSNYAAKQSEEEQRAHWESLEGQRRILLGMRFVSIDKVNAKLAELGLSPDCSIEALKEALAVKTNS